MENIESNINQYLIHEYNMEGFMAKIEKLNKKAKQLGVPSIIVNELEIVRKTDAKTKEVMLFHKIEIDGTAPKLNGWKFVARVETIKDNRHNLLFVAPNESVPTMYRESGSKCDHCNSNRYRKYTYILHHDNGEYTQVGSTCLKDFLGHANPHNFAKYLEWMEELSIYAEDGETVERSGYNIRDYKYDLEHFVSYVAEYVKQTGYFLSRTKAEEMERIATSDLVWNEIHNTRMKQEEKTVKNISDESVALAKQAIDWGIQLGEREGISDYHHNLYLSCLANVVDWRSKGIVASLLTAYQYDMELIEKKEKEKEERKASEHIGEVGKREIFTLEVIGKSEFESQFGWTIIHTFKDDHGNIVKWFSSGKEYDVGEIITVNATVNKHDDYNGTKQTRITRPTLIKKKINKVS